MSKTNIGLDLISNSVSPLELIGMFTPESILPPGVGSTISTNPYTGESGHARKGIVAATLNNIALLNTLLTENTSANNQLKIDKIIDAITPLISSLRFVGIFDFFTPYEWLSTDTQPGRCLVAILYLQQNPQNITTETKQFLVQIQDQTKIKLLSEAIKQILN
ncbi:MAG: hypothetical protein H0T62_04285 [Parachlamydiaceae bacterium]|nr:hypothetical protein [Parachlamydiaceae bacterium]